MLAFRFRLVELTLPKLSTEKLDFTSLTPVAKEDRNEDVQKVVFLDLSGLVTFVNYEKIVRKIRAHLSRSQVIKNFLLRSHHFLNPDTGPQRQ